MRRRRSSSSRSSVSTYSVCTYYCYCLMAFCYSTRRTTQGFQCVSSDAVMQFSYRSSSSLSVLPKNLLQLEPLQSSKLQDFLRKSRPGGNGQREAKTKLTTSASAFSIPQPMSYYLQSSLVNDDEGRYDGSSKLDLASIFTNSDMSLEHRARRRGKIDELRNILATDVTTLRSLFGENRNKLWGDLDNETARKLYHTLLPRVLLRVQETKDLHYSDITPDELARLAYQARVAAKEYARERCNVPGRIFAMAFDGFRHLKQYGKWSAKGMSWDEVWEKYAREIQEEILYSVQHEPDPMLEFASLKLEDLTKQVCLRILERSCKTNDTIDRLFLKDDLVEGSAPDVLLIAQRFDQEINDLIESSLCENNKKNDLLVFQNIIPFDSESAKKTARKWTVVTRKNFKNFGKEFRCIDRSNIIRVASYRTSKHWRSV